MVLAFALQKGGAHAWVGERGAQGFLGLLEQHLCPGYAGWPTPAVLEMDPSQEVAELKLTKLRHCPEAGHLSTAAG